MGGPGSGRRKGSGYAKYRKWRQSLSGAGGVSRKTARLVASKARTMRYRESFGYGRFTK